MKIYNKKPISKGIAIGRVFNYINTKNVIKKSENMDSDNEILRLNSALDYVRKNMEHGRQKAVSEKFETELNIINAHQMILEDSTIYDYIVGLIRTKKVNAEYAVNTGFKRAIKSITNTDNKYIKERIDDFKDICNQIIEVLISGDTLDFDMYGISKNTEDNSSIILFADTLSPSELIKLDKTNISGFVLNKCPENSHTAILIKSLNVPLLVGKKNNIAYAGKTCIVDGIKGTLYIDPEETLLHEYYEIKNQYDSMELELNSLVCKETITKSGKKINLFANIGSPLGLKMACENGAEGIGLLRSEVIYLQGNDYPDEDTQYDVYSRVITTFKNKPITIRTLDINYDKLPEYIINDEMESHSLLRGIEFCLKNKSIFKVQLRAILRASALGEVSLLYPMVNTVDDILNVNKIIDEVKADLLSEKIPFGEIKQGAMIETISGMNNCEEIASKCDFISIGTNDLSDDLFSDSNTRLSEVILTDYKERVLYDSIKTIIEKAHRHGKSVSICGEIGSNLKWTEKLVKAGVDTLSVTPGALLHIRSKVRNIN